MLAGRSDTRREFLNLIRFLGNELRILLTDAAIVVIESGEEAINQRTLVMAQYAGPTERRRLFERELA